jgi:hypothetical protein
VGIIEVPYRTPQVLQMFFAEGEMIIEKNLRRVAAIEIQTFNQREPDRTIIINIRFSGNAKLIPENFCIGNPDKRIKINRK